MLLSIESLDVFLRWQLLTLVGTAVSYLAFTCILLSASTNPEILPYAMIPLILYDIIKIGVCSHLICRCGDIDIKEYAKDLVECALMLMFKVTLLRSLIFPRLACCSR